MIYLFSQIAISLAFAAVVGGAIGWLIYRARAGRHINELRGLLSRQQQQVSEAQTHVSMLTNDYDELKQRSQNAIEELSRENSQIPALHQNLEKSQLLVNQLIAKHKSDSSALVNENKVLSEKAKLADDRELALAQLRAELDSEKRRYRKLSGEAEPVETEQTTVEVAESESPSQLSDEVKAAVKPANIDTKSSPERQSTMNFASSKIVDTQAPPSTDETFVKTEQLQADSSPELHHSDRANTEKDLTQIRDRLAAESQDKNHKIKDTKITDTDAVSRSAINIDASRHSDRVNSVKTQIKPNALNVQLPNQNIEPLFESVEQHDDLKQIFGIGPLTEKTLNKLGITSYSQLADLKRHDIEKIAEALHIVPDRIERDNWVGSARTQLEEVLENL